MAAQRFDVQRMRAVAHRARNMQQLPFACLHILPDAVRRHVAREFGHQTVESSEFPERGEGVRRAHEMRTGSGQACRARVLSLRHDAAERKQQHAAKHATLPSPEREVCGESQRYAECEHHADRLLMMRNLLRRQARGNVRPRDRRGTETDQSNPRCSPPSTVMVLPVMYEARGLARNTARFATSSGLPIRPIGIPAVT